MNNSSNHPPSFQDEHEKKYLPSEEKIPFPKDGTEIFQFYFPTDKLVIARPAFHEGQSVYQVFHTEHKPPLLELSVEEYSEVEKFINSGKNPKVRVRLTNNKSTGERAAYFNMKLDQRNPAAPPQSPESAVIRNREFERKIDRKTADKILENYEPKINQIIYKVRYLIESEIPSQRPFEIDIFQGPLSPSNPDRRIANNTGLITIEQELGDQQASTRAQLPEWVGQDITHDPRFTNSRLSQAPYARWAESTKPDVLSKIHHLYY